MIGIPAWIEKQLVNLYCPNCNVNMEPRYVTGAGVKESRRDKNITVVFVKYSCVKCKEDSLVEFQPMTLSRFGNALQGEMDMSSSMNRGKKNRSKITEKELQEASRIINAATNWTEILYGFGLNDEDIKKIGEESRQIDAKLDTENRNKGRQ